jgi:hypothetical protein
VPTLSQWGILLLAAMGILLLAAMVALAGAVQQRRVRKSS